MLIVGVAAMSLRTKGTLLAYDPSAIQDDRFSGAQQTVNDWLSEFGDWIQREDLGISYTLSGIRIA
jgi:hypothetical protein